MRRSAWGAVLLVVLAGWGIAGLMAVTLVSLVGWLGILIIGLAICLCAARPELDHQAPAWRYCGNTRRAWSERPKIGLPNGRAGVEHNKGLYTARTVGIAAILIGLNMFIMHQL
jgi:hypothetical protein